jgi:hypothetical protein
VVIGTRVIKTAKVGHEEMSETIGRARAESRTIGHLDETAMIIEDEVTIKTMDKERPMDRELNIPIEGVEEAEVDDEDHGGLLAIETRMASFVQKVVKTTKAKLASELLETKIEKMVTTDHSVGDDDTGDREDLGGRELRKMVMQMPKPVRKDKWMVRITGIEGLEVDMAIEVVVDVVTIGLESLHISSRFRSTCQ